MNDGPRLIDIIVLLIFAVMLRLAETVEGDDVPGWWREDGHNWRMAVDTDALQRREVGE